MRRRDFITLLGTAIVVGPLPAAAQQPAGKFHRIGMLETAPAADNTANLDAFRKGLKELGYAEGRNFAIEYRSADGLAERFPQLALELIRLPVDIIVTRGTPAALAAKDATKTIPVVMAASGDPVGNGIVASLARPGGNITGLSGFSTELAAKRVELTKEMLPGVSRIGYLGNLSNRLETTQSDELQRAARILGLEVERLDVPSAAVIGRAFDAAVARQVGAILVLNDTITQTNRQLIVDLAARYRLPAFYAEREYVDVGGLISFRVNLPKLYFRAAYIVDKILKGTPPADIPVEQPTTLEMVLNLKTAKALGLKIPDTVLLRADELIE